MISLQYCDGLAQLWICAGLAVFVVRARGISCYFQASQQLDIAREAADLRRLHAGPLVGTDKLHPFRLELPQCSRFVLRALLDISRRPALIAALSCDVECR